MSMRSFVRSVLLALGLFAAQALTGVVLARGASSPTAGAALLPYVLVSNLLVALVLVRLAERSPARGPSLVGFLFAVAFGIPALYLLETVFFDIGIPEGELPFMYLQALVAGAAAALLAAAVTGRLRGAASPLRPLALRPGRLALSTLAYVGLYTAAGLMAWPFLRSYYEGRPMPPLGTVLLLQIVRGALLSLLAWLVARHEPAGRRPAALSAGLAFSLIGGVAPLLIPGNPYLPDPTRQAHLVEVGISNLLFGVVAALLLA